jgi:hypothetical protein
VFDAVNSIDPRFEKYAAKLPAKHGASIDAAIAAATCATLVELLPSCKTALDKTMTEALAAIPEGDAKSAGLELGRSAAAAILALLKDDGSALTIDYKPGTKPGDYQPTPPDFTPAFAAHWGRVKPFVLESAAQLRPVPPPAVGSDREATSRRPRDRRWSIRPGRRADRDRQVQYENRPRDGTVSRAASVPSLWTAHRADVRAGEPAMAEGFVAGFEAKYLYNYWRPATAIRAGGDKEWLSQLPTPPIPDYPSNHGPGAAAATGWRAASRPTSWRSR